MNVLKLKKMLEKLSDNDDVWICTPRGWSDQVEQIEYTVARYVLIDKQQMCGYCEVVDLIEGWHRNAVDALKVAGYSDECFMAKEIEFTRVLISVIPKE